MAVTLNGIAQGYITDRVAALLQDAGMGDVLLDIGEVRALGRHPEGRPLARRPPPRRRAGNGCPHRHPRRPAPSPPRPASRARSSRAARHHHLFDPATGRPAPGTGQVSVIAPRATMADALSTALAVAPPARAAPLAARFPEIAVLTDAAAEPA